MEIFNLAVGYNKNTTNKYSVFYCHELRIFKFPDNGISYEALLKIVNKIFKNISVCA